MEEIQIIIENAGVPVVVGNRPGLSLGIEAGREAHLAGRIEKKAQAAAGSPLEGVVGH